MEDNTIQVAIRVETTDMFFFMLQHTYRSIGGICGVLFSVMAFMVLLWTYGTVSTSYTILLVMCSALFTIINPIMLFTGSAKQVALNPSMKIPIIYTFGETGFTMKQGKEKASAEYVNLYRIRNTKNYIYLYGSKNRANIIAKKQLGLDAQKVTELVMNGYQRRS